MGALNQEKADCKIFKNLRLTFVSSTNQDAVHAGPQPEPRPRAVLLHEAVAGGREAELGGGHLVLVPAAAPAQVPHPATHGRQHQQGDETCSILKLDIYDYVSNHYICTLVLCPLY